MESILLCGKRTSGFWLHFPRLRSAFLNSGDFFLQLASQNPQGSMCLLFMFGKVKLANLFVSLSVCLCCFLWGRSQGPFLSCDSCGWKGRSGRSSVVLSLEMGAWFVFSFVWGETVVNWGQFEGGGCAVGSLCVQWGRVWEFRKLMQCWRNKETLFLGKSLLVLLLRF